MCVRQVVLVLSATVLVLDKIAMAQPIFDHERLDDDRLSTLKRIVSMLTRLIQRKQPVATDAIEYVYEYRDAEYEYEEAYLGRARPREFGDSRKGEGRRRLDPDNTSPNFLYPDRDFRD